MSVLLAQLVTILLPTKPVLRIAPAINTEIRLRHVLIVAQNVKLAHPRMESAPLARLTLTSLQTKPVQHLARVVSTAHQTIHARLVVAQTVKLALHRTESAPLARLILTSLQTKLV